jgi:two-component system catabolic regulation response regulator CreB
MLEAAGLVLDEAKARITYHGTALGLTRYEYQLLAFLIGHPDRVYSRAQLMDLVWGSSQTSLERSVDAHVKSIRQKLRAVEPETDPIETHRGLGYSLRTDAPR